MLYNSELSGRPAAQSQSGQRQNHRAPTELIEIRQPRLRPQEWHRGVPEKHIDTTGESSIWLLPGTCHSRIGDQRDSERYRDHLPRTRSLQRSSRGDGQKPETSSAISRSRVTAAPAGPKGSTHEASEAYQGAPGRTPDLRTAGAGTTSDVGAPGCTPAAQEANKSREFVRSMYSCKDHRHCR